MESGEVHRASPARSKGRREAQETFLARDPRCRRLFYTVRSGRAWRLLPHGFPPRKTIHHSTSGFGASTVPGRGYIPPCAIDYEYASRERTPTECGHIVDSRSAKTTGVGGDRGYDGGKKVKGRKRHLLVGTDRGVGPRSQGPQREGAAGPEEGIKTLLAGAKEPFPRLSHPWPDAAGYGGEEKGGGWVEKGLGWGRWASSNARGVNLLRRRSRSSVGAAEWAKAQARRSTGRGC